MKEHFARMPRLQLDGGYYTKTRENRPLMSPLGVDDAYATEAVSGDSIISACGVADLLAAHVTGEKLPTYANDFTLTRYGDSEYQKKLDNWGESGQL
jgi:glycine/D-amino acid oxidase-like deaminating enzyme